MSTTELIELINRLPSDKQKEVEDFVSDLLDKSLSKEKPVNDTNTTLVPKKRMKFGDMKGLIKYMADDFDAPLEDFKDYM